MKNKIFGIIVFSMLIISSISVISIGIDEEHPVFLTESDTLSSHILIYNVTNVIQTTNSFGDDEKNNKSWDCSKTCNHPCDSMRIFQFGVASVPPTLIILFVREFISRPPHQFYFLMLKRFFQIICFILVQASGTYSRYVQSLPVSPASPSWNQKVPSYPPPARYKWSLQDPMSRIPLLSFQKSKGSCTILLMNPV